MALTEKEKQVIRDEAAKRRVSTSEGAREMFVVIIYLVVVLDGGACKKVETSVKTETIAEARNISNQIWDAAIAMPLIKCSDDVFTRRLFSTVERISF